MNVELLELMDEGYTWEEAEEILSRQAEERADAERDRRAEEGPWPGKPLSHYNVDELKLRHWSEK